MNKVIYAIILLIGITSFAYGQLEIQIPVDQIPYVSQPTRSGWEERGVEFRRWLAPSVRIGSRASGTMVYYDEINNHMYVLTAGHLFRKGRLKSGSNHSLFEAIEVFYHNHHKLPKPRSYKGQVLCYVWGQGNVDVYDVALMRFTPDWKNPWYIPIAPLNTPISPKAWLRSAGCDGRTEVAHYLVQFQRERNIGSDLTEYLTHYHAPRRGRSGGGLFYGDLLVGICSRGTGSQGGSVGLWSSLRQIHTFLGEEGHGFLLRGYALARHVPIVDRNTEQISYDASFIPMPRFDVAIGISLF